MRVVGKERGKVNNNSDKDDQAYVPYFERCIREMDRDGIRLPPVSKVTGPTAKIQFTAHKRMEDASQGYWERHKKEYVHKAKSDYAIFYFGLIYKLLEEEILYGVDNSKEIGVLMNFMEETMPRHRFNQDLLAIRTKVKLCLEEMQYELIDEESFHEQMQEMVDLFPDEQERERIRSLITKTIEEEDTKLGNKKRQQKHRAFQAYSQGLSVVK